MKRKNYFHFQRYYVYYITGLLLLGLIVFLGSRLLVNHYRPILSTELKKQIFKASDSLYHIDFSEINIDLFLGDLTIDSIQLSADSNKYHQLQKTYQTPSETFEVFISKFKLRHFNLLSYFFQKKIKAKSITLINPKLNVIHHQDSLKDQEKDSSNAFKKLLSGKIKNINFQNIHLLNGQINYKDTTAKSKAGDFSFNNLNLQLQGIEIDSSTAQNPSHLEFLKDFRLNLGKSLFYTPDSLYKLTIKNLRFSLSKGTGSVADLKLQPRLSETAFDRRLTFRKDRYKLSIDSTHFQGFSLSDLKNNLWHFKQFKLQNIQTDIYLNAEVPVEPVNKPLPQRMLKQAGFNVLIDSMTVENMNITYREKNPKSKKIGKVQFYKTHGYFKNITNDSAKISENKHCYADLHSSFMNRAPLHAIFDFDLADSKHTFIYKGRLGKMDAKDLNLATRPLGMVKIDSGDIHSLAYYMKADTDGASGSVSFIYDNLKVKVLSKEDLKKQGLVSLAANLLMIKKGNIDDSTSEQNSQIYYSREPYRSVFNLMWKSIFKGVKPLIGVDEKTQEKIEAIKNTKKDLKKEEEKVKSGNFWDKAKNFIKETVQKVEGKK